MHFDSIVLLQLLKMQGLAIPNYVLADNLLKDKTYLKKLPTASIIYYYDACCYFKKSNLPSHELLWVVFLVVVSVMHQQALISGLGLKTTVLH